MMNGVVGKVIVQAYMDNDEMDSLECTRSQRAFKYSIGNGYFKLLVECYGGEIGCAWTGALSLKPHELVLGNAKDLCYEKAFCCQVCEFLWACIHKMNELAAKRRCSGFTWPAIRPLEEYVEAGHVEEFAPKGDADMGIDADAEAERRYQQDDPTLDDEVLEVMEEAAEFDGDKVEPDPALDGFLSGNDGGKKKRHIFGRKGKDDGEDEIASMGDDHVHPELAEGYFDDKSGNMETAETLDDLEGV